ncbi:putative transport system permease [Shigella sonnei]|nr:putative transport system permease [Shigella sonnei]SIW72340.1 putative transport system permease [Shigella sonnei]SIW80199.1 putative transport system permease [Shigella sonnei]SIW81931.1 putative transport system permease [Shigella sonnei]SIW82259.1 putative transport system permease [Shigella sonnei]
MRSPHASGLNQTLQHYSTEHNSIAETFNLSVWPLVAVLLVITLWVVMKELKKPKLKVATLPPRRTGIAHILFEKRWHPFVTAVLIGLIALLAWPLSEATGRMFGLGITSPTANILQFLVAGDVKYINWGVFLVLGIFVGSFIAAKASREFRVRAADAQTTLRSGLGGVLMGFGASIAGGCFIGNGLVMTAMMTWQGWIGLVFMILGVWTASWLVYVRPQRKARLATAAAN